MNSAEAVDVNVVTIVDGVTRQLQTLLKRSVAEGLSSMGGSGSGCLFTG